MDKNNHDMMKTLLIEYIDLNLERVSKTFSHFFKEEHGLSPNQMSTIWYLRKSGAMSMGEAAIKLHMSKQQLTKLVETLVEKGVVNRVYNDKNRRMIQIELSQKGKDIIYDVEKRYVTNFVKQCDHLSKEEEKEFLLATATINRILPKLNLGPSNV